MSTDLFKTVVTFVKDKEAALYFDNVVPLLCNDFWIDRALEPRFFEVMDSLLPKYLLKKFTDYYFSDDCPDEPVTKHINKAAYGDNTGILQIVLKFKILLGNSDIDNNHFIDQFIFFLWKFDLMKVPIIFSDDELTFAIVDSESKGIGQSLITLTNLALVDCEKTSWDQILEIRKDEKSHKKLRRLRLFLSQNYLGKDRTFIQDDLAQRIDDYQQTIKEWGFKTKTSCMSTILNSKSIVAYSGATLVSILLGEPLIGIGTAFTGIITEIGKVSLEIAKSRYDLEKLKREHPVDYIFHVRKELGIKNKVLTKL